MPEYNHNDFMQVIERIQEVAQVTGLTDFKQEEDTYPRVKLRSKHSKKNSARELIKKKIGLIGAQNFITLQVGLLHHANKALDNRHCKRAAFILDLIEICEDYVGGTTGLCDLKTHLKKFADIGRKQEYNLALQKEQKRSKSSRSKGNTYKFPRTDGYVNSFLIESNGDSWYLLRKLEKDKQLGHGVGGTVKTIVRVDGTEPYAIKMVKSKNSSDRKLNQKARRAKVDIKNEWNTLSRLDGSIANKPIGKLSIYEGANGSSSAYFITPKAKHDMYDLLFVGKNNKQKRKAVAETAQCIQEMHTLNTAHHDIKPENILILDNGTIRLCDFGLAYPITGSKNKKVLPRGCTPGYLYDREISGPIISRQNKCDSNMLPATHWDIFAFLMILIDAYSVGAIELDWLKSIFRALGDEESYADKLVTNIELVISTQSTHREKAIRLNEGLTEYFKINRVYWSENNNLTMENVIAAMHNPGVRNQDEQAQVSAPLRADQQLELEEKVIMLGAIDLPRYAQKTKQPDQSAKTCCCFPCCFFECVEVKNDSPHNGLDSPFIEPPNKVSIVRT